MSTPDTWATRHGRMFPYALFLCALALWTPASGVLAEEQQAPPRTVIKTVRFADVEAIQHLIELVDVEVAVEPKTKNIVLRGPDSRMETAIALIDALDTPEPPWGIELMVHLVKASKEPLAGATIPPRLKAAVSEVAELVGYRGLELVDTVFLHATTDAGGAGIKAPVGDSGTFEVSFDAAKVIYGEPKNWILFENLTVTSGAAGLHVRTNVKVLEDHQVLIGKSGLRGEDADLVLIIETQLKATWPRDSNE